MFRLAALVMSLFAVTQLPAAEFPEANWQMHTRDGWSTPMLRAAREYAATKQTAAVVIVQHGRIVDQWGKVDKKIEVRSVRKSLLNALYGIHVAEGNIDLGNTLADIGIDDLPPALTTTEKQATILDLLRARSGVYHATARETKAMRAARPKRGSHRPGSFFYYNNWDFNVLGSIFEQQTNKNIFEEFVERIGKPIGMQDFIASDGRFAGPEGSMVGGDSLYLNYIFSMTARDMARFGYLYLRNGRWADKQILTESWVTRSTTSYSDVQNIKTGAIGYGLLWQTYDWGFAALGYGGHVIAVIPSKDIVVIHRVDNNPPKDTDVVPYADVFKLVQMILEAATNAKGSN